MGFTAKLTHERCQAVFDALGHGVCLLDAQGRIEQVNRAMQALLGKPTRELIGHRPEDLIPGLPDPKKHCPFHRLRKTLQRESAELHLAGRWFQLTADPMLDPKGRLTGAVVTVADITRQRSLEEQLRRSQKMEAVGRLAGGLAHNFNNLLTIIAGYSQMALDGLPSPHQARRDLAAIMEATARATSLTRQLLTIGHRQRSRPRRIDLNQVVSRMRRILHGVVGPRIQLELLLKPRLGGIKADPTLIEQLVMNLVVNARDAMPKGGRVLVQTAELRVPAQAPPDRPNLAPGLHVCLTISDTGAGMDAETRNHVFEPFFSTKPRSKGTGLGLSIVYGIVKQSGGDIEVDSELGKGTTFRIWFPCWRPAPPRRRGAPRK